MIYGLFYGVEMTDLTEYKYTPPLTETKTYFWVRRELAHEVLNGNNDTHYYTFMFPPEFMASRNRKWIVVEECKATLKDKLVGDVIMHASFILRDHYLDYACCFVNEEANRNTAKYEYNGSYNTFRLWFTDLSGNMVDIDAFALRTLLIY